MKILLFIATLFFGSMLISSELDENRTYVVAFAQDTLDNDFRLAQVNVLKKELDKYKNIKFIYSDAKANTSLQIKHIEDFINQGVDILITSPYDEKALNDIVSKAYRSNIPVILISRSVIGDEYTTHIHPDNKQIAVNAAKYLAKNIQYKGNVLLLKGVPKADSTRIRTAGFYEVISNFPDIKVIERTGNYLRRDALLEVEKLLDQGVHLDAIMSQSDSMLVGARMVLKSKGIDPASIFSVGIDYINPARDAIRQGKQNSSFLYSLSSKKTAETVVKILSGQKVPKEILIDTIQITKENVENVTPVF